MIKNSKFSFSIFIVMLFTMFVAPVSAFADSVEVFSVDVLDTVTEGELELDKDDIGDIKQHDLFEFEASIKEKDIIDGGGDFDMNDQPGNDSGPNNGIIRTWDTITYPVKITVNPKNNKTLSNIVLDISGSLANGISGKDRINARFSVGGYEDVDKGVVGFNQQYTIEQTGNSIMIPISVEVLGAKPNILLKPSIDVQVVSVDGKDIKKDAIQVSFEDLPSAKVSGVVNIKPYNGTGLAGHGLAYYPFAGITGDEENKENIHAFSMAWGIDRLPNKTDQKGSTFPDTEGKINYRVKLSGYVDWLAPPYKTGREHFNFDNKDLPVMLYDQQPIDTVRNKIGSANMLSEGHSYRYNYPHNYTSARSSLPDFSKSSINSFGRMSVWDSGSWRLDAPEVSSSTVTYDGENDGYIIGSTFPRHRADGWSGSDLYGVNDRIFSTNSFVLLMPNEYRMGGKNNPDSYENNTHYRYTVELIDYESPEGEVITFNKSRSGGFMERNTGNGGFHVQHAQHAHPSNRVLGTPHIGDVASTGDASTLIGEDVQLRGYFLHRMNLYGGYQTVNRWNTDIYEFTKAFATIAERNFYNDGYYNYKLERVSHDYENQKVSYGVAKFSDNSFKSFTNKGKYDYSWYDSYDEASSHGEVGAIMNDVNASIPPSNRGYSIPLEVKQKVADIGAINKNGTANISVMNAYAYMDGGRTHEIDVTRDRTYNSPAKWSDTGVLLEPQSPYGSGINFQSLAILPAEVSSNITSNKKTYYNSEQIDWRVRSSIVLPASGVPSDLDTSVRLIQTLPKGLDYINGSGKIGSSSAEPEIRRYTDGKVDLIWDVLLSEVNHTIEEIQFSTTINPFALNSGSVQSGLTVTNEIVSELDGRPKNLRTSSASVSILKVGMVGIHESINKLHGGKNSEYALELRPYTTIEEEKNVVGLTHIPQNNDENGSIFDGAVFLKGINLRYNRVYDGDVSVYLNNKHIENDKPQNMDMNSDGWYMYDEQSEEDDLSMVKSIFFRVNGLMSSSDDIALQLKVGTMDNSFGDRYLNRTVINSDTDYKLSPRSNAVQYVIRADLELALERVRIYTDSHQKGLPVNVWVNQVVLDREMVKDSPITIAIYNKKGNKVNTSVIKQKDLKRLSYLDIPSEYLKKDSSEEYTIKIEDYDDNHIWIKGGMDSLSLEGYTASEKVLKNDRGTHSVEYEGIVATEKSLVGEDVTHKYYENIIASTAKIPKISAGYGYEIDVDIKYTNDLLQNVLENGIKDTTELTLMMDSQLVDESLGYEHLDDGFIKVPLVSDDLGADKENGRTMSYQLPTVFMQRGSGNTYTQQQTTELNLENVVNAGNKLYTPLWIDNLGEYDLSLISEKSMGSNYILFDITNVLNIDSYMFSHIDSESSDDDALLIYPLNRNDDLFGRYER